MHVFERTFVSRAHPLIHGNRGPFDRDLHSLRQKRASLSAHCAPCEDASLDDSGGGPQGPRGGARCHPDLGLALGRDTRATPVSTHHLTSVHLERRVSECVAGADESGLVGEYDELGSIS